MIDVFKNEFWSIIGRACTVLLHMLKYVLGTQEAFDEAVRTEPLSLAYVPDYFETQEMYNEELGDFPDHFKNKTMCEKAVKDEPEFCKTEEMCKEAVRREPYTLGHVLINLVTQKLCEKAVKKDSW